MSRAWIGGLVSLALVALAVWAWPGIQRARAQRRLDARWTTLKRMTRDPGVAKRLVEGEHRRHPELDEAACVERAIAQIRSDQR